MTGPSGIPSPSPSVGRVHFGTDIFPTQGVPGTRFTLCQHLDGTVSILRERPDRQKLPIVLFSNRPP